MTPRYSVYFLDPTFKRALPLFFTACDDRRDAIQVASALRGYFRCAAWVEAWDCRAHYESQLQQDVEAILSRPIDTAALPLSPSMATDPRR
jgi:hypothetical protein